MSWAATAATVVEYNFNAGLTADGVFGGVTATPLTGVNVNFGGTVNIGGWLNNPVGQFSQWTGSTPDAIEFTLTPAAGHTLDLDYLSFAANSQSLGSGDHGPSVWRVEVFRDGAGVLATDFNVPAFDAWVIPIIDLTGLTFTPGESFRARIEGLGANNGDRQVSFDNIFVEGQMVPEPGAFALVAGLGLVAFGAFRRVRRGL